MEIEVLLELIELILTQKGDTGAFAENITKKKFMLDEETLFIATQIRQIEFVRFVLNNGVKPTLESFQYAAEHDFFELCRLFVEFGSRKILSTPELETELMTNLTNGLLMNFKNLVNRGIDFTANNNCCIQWASALDSLETVSFLLEHGTDSIGKDKALSAASEMGQLEIVRLLLEYGADLKANNNKAIRSASHRGHLEVVQLLLEKGADPTDNKNYAIKWASQMGRLEIVRLLLNNDSKYKVDPTAQNNFAIRWASQMGHLGVVQLLLDNGADPTAKDNDAIQLASEMGHFEVVRLLLDNGFKYKVDPTANNNYAIRHASGPNKDEIIALLKRYGAKL
jgi:ankyrin repeat protein